MNIIAALLIILFVLMLVVGGKKGAKSFFTLIFNFIILFIMLILIACKLDPIKVTIFISIIISSITLFYINGFNKKTVASLLSVTLVVLLTMIITSKIGINAKIQGFGYEQYESISSLSLYVQLNFTKIVICEILVGLLGAIIDVSISISSSMNELYKNNSLISQNNLFKSGMNIGKDILGTMTNTLFFAFISGFMTLIYIFH
ncbi:YibE/F family protein [Clostridium tetanomorphum DSM 665]|nr:YibE/F family protein [Clostridium tetanomorphum DSM 665]